MNKTRLALSFMLASALSITFTACQKDGNETTETIVSAEDNSTIESEFTSMFDVADDFSSNDHRTRAGNTILPSGAVVTFQDSSYSDGDGVECTIDFGPVKNTVPKGMLCQDGRFRAGVIHISSTKRYFLDSAQVSVYTTDADNFFAGNDGVNLTKLTGNITLTRLSTASLKIDVTNAKAVNDKGSVAWQSSRIITKTVDAGPGLIGDQFTISGDASGVNRNGESFTVNIDVPLLKKIEMGCARTFIVGKITLTNVSTGKAIKIDYDPLNDQACDLKAKATINNKEFFFFVR